jgi:hypothetical protein
MVRDAAVIAIGFGEPEHHGDGSPLPSLVQGGNFSLEIRSMGGYLLSFSRINHRVCHGSDIGRNLDVVLVRWQ